MFGLDANLDLLLQQNQTILILAGLALGVFLIFVGVFYPAPDTARIARRMYASGAAKGREGPRLLRDIVYTPSGLMKALMPLKEQERSEVALHLAQAGFAGRGALVNYYILRTVFGLVLPLGFAGLYFWAGTAERIAILGPTIAGLAPMTVVQVTAVGVLLGFYGPAHLVRLRVAERRTRIRLAFPNALDLIKVGIEAGMGFDAAMTRVAQEIRQAAPDLSIEIIDTQREILAGRDRTAAYQAMANRMGIEEARSFAALIVQSRQFGTSAAQALTIYSEEMRQRRELLAQEKANKLPVQMSAVMAVFMMPTLIVVTVGPAIIRYLDFLAS